MKPRITSVTHVPRLRQQRSIAAAVLPSSAGSHHPVPTPTAPGRFLPGQLGRFPTVGLDPGAIPGTRPDQHQC
jgi:hypothetical protein